MVLPRRFQVLSTLATATLIATCWPSVACTQVTWHDADDAPLPFATVDDIERFLETADIISNEAIHTGRTGPRKLVLEQNGVRAAAAFNAVDRLTRGVTRIHGITVHDFHDYHLFNLAAYRLDRMLGLNRVPPTVRREVDGAPGTVSLWIEHAIMERERETRDLQPPNPFRWAQQKKMMLVFDNLIGNVDRNQGNVLIDRRWRLWFIDHTRAFVTTSALLNPKTLNRCERGLYHALRELDGDEVRRELSPVLTGAEIDAVLARRDLIVERLQEEIDRLGERVVLFELQPPGPETGTW